MNLPKITIIIPCYNVQDYVQKCIYGIEAQTYLNWEAIFIDDGSTDKTLQMLKLHTKENGKYKIIHKDNGGVSSARNLGLKHSTGEYIYFCDPDDMMMSNLLEKSVTTAINNDADIVIFGYKKIDSDGNLMKKRIVTKNGNFNGNNEIKQLFLYLDKNELFNPPWNKLFRKELITINHLEFELIPKGEDAIFNAESFFKANKITSIKEILYEYLVNRDGSVEMKLDENDFYFFKLLIEKKLMLLKKLGISDKDYYSESLIGASYSETLKIMEVAKSVKEYSLLLKKSTLFNKQNDIVISKRLGTSTIIKLLLIRCPRTMYFIQKSKRRKMNV